MNKGATLESVLRGLRASGLHPRLLSDVSGGAGIVVVAVLHELPQAETDWALLTDRERDVARLAAGAMTNVQIARRLGISAHTVNYHLRQIFQKLGIVSRVSLAGYTDPE
ncbi:helix-turn-helix transcriptional regulator [Dactylosporangium salmoneum]|uniref:HTH luxR-type domain-containing protein n=1 Tax=Dactylosporangium salmoneum TaxID=53361 RepID=A0ABP5UAH5_9ACTN